MKSKRGFTLIETIAVVVVLALIIVLVVPVINSSSSSTKKKAYETKVAMIENAAVLYGQDHYREIIEGADGKKTGYAIESTENIIYKNKTITVADLVPDYYTSDSTSSSGLVEDPRSAGNYLDSHKIIIKINTNTRKVTAYFQE